MKYKVIVVGLLVVNLLVYLISSLVEMKKFFDVLDSVWLKDVIYYLVERNVINGMLDGNFMLYGNLICVQVVKIIVIVIGVKVDLNVKLFYNDVKNSWVVLFIVVMEKENIIKG